MIAALALGLTLAAGDQNALNTARDLYASAAYEDALAVLNRVPEASSPPDEARTLSQYRAFCLIALGRTAEADRAIETMITRDPTYQPPANEMSPRVRTAFIEVRRRIMPAIIQQTYAQAKTAFDRKEYEAAAAGFGRVLEVMNDPDLASVYRQPPLSDLRTLAGGFRDLAVTAATPPPPPVIVAAPVAPPSAPRVPDPPRVYAAGDPGVVPPQALRQELPPYPGQLPMVKQGSIEVVIDETGTVESARMRQSVTVPYDALALKAVSSWRYVPATLEGRPVKFRKVVQITVNPKKG
jgi:TonB family protein